MPSQYRRWPVVHLLSALAFLLVGTTASPFTQHADPAQVFFGGSPSLDFNLPTLTNNIAIKFDEDGSMLDAHDGKVYWAEDEQLYILVGAAYDCGFRWQARERTWCGIRIYSSPDLLRWKNHGLAVPPDDSKPEHGFRPKLAFNKSTKLWVLFWNVHNDHYPELGLEIWTSKSVLGGYEFASRPNTLGTPNDFAVGVDGRTGKGYLIYGLNLLRDLTIEELTDDYLRPSGNYILLPHAMIEGFDMQWHEPSGRFYLIIYGTETLMFGSDLWDNANPNEAKAYLYWEPLTIGPHGVVPSLKCKSNHTMDFAPAPSNYPEMLGGPNDPMVDASSGEVDFRWVCDTPNLGEYMAGQHLQSWTVGRDGTLTELGFAASRLHTDGQLNVDIWKFTEYGSAPTYDPVGLDFVARREIFPENMNWGVKNYKVEMSTPVKKVYPSFSLLFRPPFSTLTTTLLQGDRLLFTLSAQAATNHYCFAVRNATEPWNDNSSPRMHAYHRGTHGGTRNAFFRWVPDALELKFYTIVR
ncbi:hypothetical protein P7C70_g2584, partial [Phenoliferia sp. Uapishka_3]